MRIYPPAANAFTIGQDRFETVSFNVGVGIPKWNRIHVYLIRLQQTFQQI